MWVKGRKDNPNLEWLLKFKRKWECEGIGENGSGNSKEEISREECDGKRKRKKHLKNERNWGLKFKGGRSYEIGGDGSAKEGNSEI